MRSIFERVEYAEYLNSDEWKKKREARKQIDGYKCVLCGRPMDLQVHHLNYYRIFHEDVCRDLVTLCKYHHEEAEEMKRSRMKASKWWYEQQLVDLAEKNAKKALMSSFLDRYKEHDFIYGGNENLCDYSVIRKYLNEMKKTNDYCPGIGEVCDYFRDRKIELIFRLKDQGASPSDVLARGISKKMVYKYWDNKELAEEIVHHSL